MWSVTSSEKGAETMLTGVPSVPSQV